MNSRKLSTIAILGFVLLGVVFIGLRYQARQKAQMGLEESLWRLTYEVQFSPKPSEEYRATVRLPVPFDTRYCEVLFPYSANHPDLGFRDRTIEFHHTRELVLTTQGPGRYFASANFDLRLRPPSDLGPRPPFEYLPPAAEVRFLQSTDDIPVDNAIVRTIANQAKESGDSPKEWVQAIFEYCNSISSGETDTVTEVIDTKKDATAKGRARTMVALCRAIRIPARLVCGFEIKQARGRLAVARDAAVATEPTSKGAEPHVWMEAFLDQRWEPFDPTYGYSYTTSFVPVRRGGDEVIVRDLVADGDFVATYSITRLEAAAEALQSQVRRPIQILDLTRLPVPMHKVMKILLLLPFAALITTFLRNVVGLGTFGTFSPALLAMSFIYADLKTGLAILIIVIVVGLFGRSFLERLRLLMVPRLSIILTMVILCVVFGLSALHYLLPQISAEVVLLPMIILTMLIERFHVTMEEDGLLYTVKLAAGTMLVAVLCYLVLRWETVGSTVLIYPEAHFFTIAAFILLGRYAGYRLTELWRFRDLVEESETK